MKEETLDQMVNELKEKFSGSVDYMSGVNDASYVVLRKAHLNRYFLPEGTDILMRIFEFGLKGESEAVKKFMNDFINKYPDNPYNKSFTRLLNGQYPFTKHKEFEKQIPICPDCNRQLVQLNDIEWFCDNFECPNENIFKYNGTVLEQEKSPFTKVQREYFGVEVKNNKRISATGARLNVENSKIKTDFQKESEIELIYDTITKTSKAGFSSVYIKDINISDEIKSILEKDGFLIKTNYSRGFEIKWNNETDKSVSLSEELKKQL